MSKVSLPRRVLARVEKPARYTGGEWNVCVKPEAEAGAQPLLHFAFCFPDLYEIGMSNLALRILYNLINLDERYYCERVFAPAADMRTQMQRENIPLFSLESRRPLADFDIIGFTLQYEMSYPTILEMLHLGAVPIWQKDRGEGDPFVIAGGPCVYNAEPVADFFDLILIGEGEELLPELLECYGQWRLSGAPRLEFLRLAAKLDGVYVPSFYVPNYDAEGIFNGLSIVEAVAPAKIKKRIIANLDEAVVPLKVMVPNLEIVHDRIFLELFRGCANGCRFCQAGMIYRPVRERSVSTLLQQAEAMINSSGYDEIGLLSLSSGDYRDLLPLTEHLLELCATQRINLSLPSLRLDSISLDLLQRIAQTRKAGLTFAPEAGSQRLRDTINKNIKEEDLLNAASFAFANGWQRLKLYFMLGLPGEEDADILAIATLCEKITALWFALPKEQRRGKLALTVSTSFFIPKAATPFQWEGQITAAEMKRRQNLLASKLNSHYISYQWHDFAASQIEALLARGDRRLAKVLYRIWQEGAWLESWSEYFSWERWLSALSSEQLSLDFYIARSRGEQESFPWEHIESGVRTDFLRREKQKAELATTSSNCYDSCQLCGLSHYGAGVCRQSKAE